MIFTWTLDHNRTLSFDFPVTRNFLQNTKFDFVKFRKVGYTISIIMITLSIGSLFVRGLNYGVDFSGGRTYVVRFDNEVKTTVVREALTKEFDGMAPEVKTFGPTTQVKITTKYLIDDQGTDVDSILQHRL